MNRKDRKNRPPADGLDFGAGGILKGIGDVLEKLNQLAETGQELSRSGEIREGAHVKGIYGFTVRTGIGGDPSPRIEPFGNIRQDAKTGRAVVQDVREPVVDVFEEQDCVLVVAEMPGITLEDVKLATKDKVLILNAENADKKYRKEIELPRSFPREKLQLSCNNGVLEIKCVP